MEAVNNVIQQIKINLSMGDSPSQAIERHNVKKAMEILAGQMHRKKYKWLGNMTNDELIAGWNKSQTEI